VSFFNELKRRNVFRVGVAYTVATWLLIQVADTVFPRIGLPDSAVTLVIALLAIGFIPALIFAWAFEMTPEGIKREKDVDRNTSITSATGRRLNRWIITGLILVIAVLGVERTWFAGQEHDALPQDSAEVAVAPEQGTSSETAEESGDKRESVAVLPFTAMSSGEDDGYFADGLTEEILNSLARLPELLVTARTSSFHFKGKDLPIPEIARTLGVNNVVEGSVRRSGERVRITAQLIRAEDGFHLWSDTYDRTLEDVFSVQEDIAENIASTLDVVLNEDKRQQMRDARIDDVEAFIAYQKGMEMMSRAHSISNPIELLPEANRYFDQALAIVPSISNAHLERTDLYGHIIYNSASGLEHYKQDELDAALAEIQSGLALAARYAQLPAQRAYLEAERAEFSDNWSSLPLKFDRAFETDKCYAVNWVQSLAAVFGWAAEVSAHYERLMRCDPMSSIYAALGGQFMLWAGQADEVITLSDEYLKKAGSNSWVDDVRFLALLATGRYREFPGIADATPEGSYLILPRWFIVHALENEIAAARAVLDAAAENMQFDDASLLIAEAIMGNRQAANDLAGKMDARFAGPFILAEAVKGCFCGAPFDLDATPNFKQRIEEAGFDWPPAAPIKYPAKDW
jgi:TolB-like protein